jgi:hypothetical protein
LIRIQSGNGSRSNPDPVTDPDLQHSFLGKEITKKTLEHWESGRSREELTYQHLEEIINLGAFNEKGPLNFTVLDPKLFQKFYYMSDRECWGSVDPYL